MTKNGRIKHFAGMNYEAESLKKQNIKLSEEIEYFGMVASNMRDKIKQHAIQMENNLARQFELEDTIKDVIN